MTSDCLKRMLDPRTSGLAVVLLGITAMFMNKALTAHIIFAVAAIYLLCSKAVKACLVYVSIYLLITVLSMNVESIENTSIMLLVVSLGYFVQKLTVLIMMGQFFARTARIPDVLTALQQMKMPDALAVPLIVALRFFPTIREDYHSLRDSLRLRNVRVSPVMILVRPVKTIEYLFVPILRKSVRVSDELAASALVRGFEHMKDQTILFPLKFGKTDIAVTAATVMTVVVLFIIQFY